MNLRVLLAGALGGLALYIWLFISWALLPFHMESLNGIEHSARLDALLLEMGAEPGLNYYPGTVEGMSREEHIQLAKSVPGIGIMSFSPDGMDMNDPMPHLRGLLGAIVAALLVAQFMLLLPGRSGYGGRVLLCTLFGAAAFLCTSWINGGFFMYPMRHLLIEMSDGLIGWTLAGLVIAALVKPQASAEPVDN